MKAQNRSLSGNPPDPRFLHPSVLARHNGAPLLQRGCRLCVSIAVIFASQSLCAAADPHSTASLSIDRSLQQPLAAAKGHIERGQYAEAIRTLQPVLGNAQNSLVFVDGRYIDAKVAANRLIAGLPSEARAIYEREFGSLAQRELEQAKASGRLEQVLAVATTYRQTEAGRRALATAAGLFFDGGQFFEAAAIANQLLEMPGTIEQPAAAARLVTAWLKLGRIDAARQWVEKRREILARQKHRNRGNQAPLGSMALGTVPAVRGERADQRAGC